MLRRVNVLMRRVWRQMLVCLVCVLAKKVSLLNMHLVVHYTKLARQRGAQLVTRRVLE